MAEKHAWGFIGLGEMGQPMAENLVKHGIAVTVFDRSAERMELASRGGCVLADSVRELASANDVIAICVRDASQLDAVIDDGLAWAARPGAIVVIHSTVGPATCRRIAKMLAKQGVAVLDAPVSGMRLAADAGTLTFFVGGSGEALASARRGLEAMGAQLFHVGDVGAGQAVKVANNAIAFGIVGLVDEAIEVAAAAGVSEASLLPALQAGSARSWVIENWAFLRHEWGESQPGGAAAVRTIVRKDLELEVHTAGQFALQAPFASLAAERVPALLGQAAAQRKRKE